MNREERLELAVKVGCLDLVRECMKETSYSIDFLALIAARRGYTHLIAYFMGLNPQPDITRVAVAALRRKHMETFSFAISCIVVDSKKFKESIFPKLAKTALEANISLADLFPGNFSHFEDLYSQRYMVSYAKGFAIRGIRLLSFLEDVPDKRSYYIGCSGRTDWLVHAPNIKRVIEGANKYKHIAILRLLENSLSDLGEHGVLAYALEAVTHKSMRMVRYWIDLMRRRNLLEPTIRILIKQSTKVPKYEDTQNKYSRMREVQEFLLQLEEAEKLVEIATLKKWFRESTYFVVERNHTLTPAILDKHIRNYFKRGDYRLAKLTMASIQNKISTLGLMLVAYLLHVYAGDAIKYGRLQILQLIMKTGFLSAEKLLERHAEVFPYQPEIYEFLKTGIF